MTNLVFLVIRVIIITIILTISHVTEIIFNALFVFVRTLPYIIRLLSILYPSEDVNLVYILRGL